jgi:hypothetical protein
MTNFYVQRILKYHLIYMFYDRDAMQMFAKTSKAALISKDR